MSDITAIILCGGKGERLRPFTEHLPKPLVPVNGQPILHHLLSYLSRFGIHRSILCVGYKAECIEQFTRDCGRSDWDLTCVNGGDASMADRVLQALPHVRGRGLICYGDTLANVDLAALERDHRAASALATLAVFPLHSPFGIVQFDDSSRIIELAEKPVLPHWINIGFLLCEPEAFRFLKPRTDLVQFSSELSKAGVIYAYRHTGRHITINTEKDRAHAEAAMVDFATVMDYQAL